LPLSLDTWGGWCPVDFEDLPREHFPDFLPLLKLQNGIFSMIRKHILFYFHLQKRSQGWEDENEKGIEKEVEGNHRSALGEEKDQGLCYKI
jgi:hypothetical protein